MKDNDQFAQLRKAMVENQIVPRGVADSRVLDAMRSVARHAFIPENHRDEAYQDRPLPLGFGQTISQPYVVALMSSVLQLSGKEKVLEIGTGSGYQAAVLSRLAKFVHTVERIPELASLAETALKQQGYSNVAVHVGDGSLGWPDDAPYDCIIVTAAAPSLPEALSKQLITGGRMAIPVGERWRQMLELWVKMPSGMQRTEILPVVFVPLLGQDGWQEAE
jgi:protein-L-isoaspartate(D-aspartate) O-methyltransferase